LIALFILIRDASGNLTSEASAHFLSDWRQCLKTYGPGCIHIELDRLVAVEAGAKHILLCLDRAHARIKSFGQNIPGDVLNDRNPAVGVKFSDFPVPVLENALIRLRSLISENLIRESA